MILQALNDYYERKQKATDGALPPQGFDNVQIGYLLVLQSDGSFDRIEPRYKQDKKKRVGEYFLLPQPVKRAAGIAANTLWDKKEYVLGVQTPVDHTDSPNKVAKAEAEFNKKAVRLPQQLAAFAEIVDELFNQTNEPQLAAVQTFLSDIDHKALASDEYFDELLSSDLNLSFKIRGSETLVAQSANISSHISNLQRKSTKGESVCLVSGEIGAVQRLHPALKGVRGAQSAGGNIVSFNSDSFCSYGKGKQDPNNAPVSQAAAFAYTTALNSLLDRNNKQCFQVGHTSTVCWAQCESPEPVELEYTLPGFMDEIDDPDLRTEQVANLYKSVQSGAYLKDDGDTAFYVLGLAPNNARLSVHFWLRGTVASFSKSIANFFNELDIDGREKIGHPSLFRLLCATAAFGKADNINPVLERAVINAALDGKHYPQAVLSEVLRRAKAERDINYYRAALIKAWLVRNRNKELTVSLDPDYQATGYQLGRLFATLEKLQEAANPGLNATIRDRYFSAASSAPVTVFSTLLRLSNHHLKKLEGGMPVFFEKQLGEIITKLDAAPFPARLSLEAQGEFAIGYYQQRQAFFKRKEETTEVESES
jgi:CRISPR-associated protein Csd1